MTFSLGSSLRILVANWKNLFVSETRFRFCGIDSRISFLALAIASKKISKTVSETCAMWLRFGTVSETRGLASDLPCSQRKDI